MKIVLDTSVCYTTRKCVIVLLLHDTHSVCHENRAGHKYPSIVLLLHDTHSVCYMKIVLDTSIRPSCYCYTTRTVCNENRAGH